MSCPEELMAAKLLATEAVTDLVAAAIRPLFLLDGDTLPGIIYRRVSTEFQNCSAGTTTDAQAIIEVTCIATTYAAVKDLAKHVRVALSGWNDSLSQVWHLQSESDDVVPIPAGEDTFAAFDVTQTYLVGFTLDVT